MENVKESVYGVITNDKLSYHQKRQGLAYIAENTLDYPQISDEAKIALDNKFICDLFEGSAPFRPRYILPDYPKALKNGIQYLELDAPDDLDEAINFLSILYTHVPSVTTFPVYLGNIDKLLLPFVKDTSEQQLYKKIKLFWRFIDRCLPDAFVHANIGPEDNIVARTILKVERDCKQAVPNLSLKYSSGVTSDELLNEAIKTVFDVAKPHIVNHDMVSADFKGDYGVVSCYNSLPEGGGSHTLVRLNLKKVVDVHNGDIFSFLNGALTTYVSTTLDIIESRIRYLVEQSKYFENDFLVKEGIVSLDNFSAMFGFFGLAECVNNLIAKSGGTSRYGKDSDANNLAYSILNRMKELVDARELPYCKGNNSKALFHAQSGIDTDTVESAGARIPVGEEPDLYQHIAAVAPHHHLFNGGISDVFHFDDTAKRNPRAIHDIILGAFKNGMRMFTFNISNSEFIRITGYLVKRSDVEAFKESGSRFGSTLFGYNSMENCSLDDRITKQI